MKILNCFENASLISRLAQFTDQIQTVSGKSPEISDLGQKILKTLIDINPSIVQRTEARTTVWTTEDGLLTYIQICITPPVRSAIKYLFLETFKYKAIPDHHILEPSADANDMRLNLHEENLQRQQLPLREKNGISA